MPISTEEIRESLKVNFPNLKLIKCINSRQIIVGSLQVNHRYNDFPVNESFEIEIEIPEDYPYSIPIVKETGNKVSEEYSHRYSDGSLCLGVDGEIMLKCGGIMTLEYLINTYVIPFFFSYRYYERFGEYPFGERTHGCIGILESYADYFNVSDQMEVYRFLKYAVSNQYRGHLPCPCNSGKRVRDCHGKILRLINESKIIKETLSKDLKTVDEELAVLKQH